jgi:hypothetical protein
MEIYDDEFIPEYEAALIIYETSCDRALDKARHFGPLPDTHPEEWILVGPTTIGGGFHRRGRSWLDWIYAAGVAIRADPFDLRGEFHSSQQLRQVQEAFYAVLCRWKRNRC